MKRDTQVTQQYPQLIPVGGNMVTEAAGKEFLVTTNINILLLLGCFPPKEEDLFVSGHIVEER